MIKSIRHLRGTKADWERHNAVIPDGEIAILKSADAPPKIKIGNGTDTFSSLSSITGDTVITNEREITLMHGKSYRLGECAALTLTVPSPVEDDYYSEVSFDSGDDATELLVNSKIRLTGDGVCDEELLPRPKTHYTIFVWYDGELQGIVRGLPNA